jgi:hypothetical protein
MDQFIEYARFLAVVPHVLQMKYVVMELAKLPVLFHSQSSELGIKILYSALFRG